METIVVTFLCKLTPRPQGYVAGTKFVQPRHLEGCLAQLSSIAGTWLKTIIWSSQALSPLNNHANETHEGNEGRWGRTKGHEEDEGYEGQEGQGHEEVSNE